MKYVLMFTSTPADDAAVSPERAQEVYRELFDWFRTNDGHVVLSSVELQPVGTASTVRHADSGSITVDGPFTEAREAVAGVAVVDVPNHEAALELARSWPMLVLPGTSVEVRPSVTDYSQFE